MQLAALFSCKSLSFFLCAQAFADELTEVTEEDIRIAEQRSKDRALGVRAAMANRSVSLDMQSLC